MALSLLACASACGGEEQGSDNPQPATAQGGGDHGGGEGPTPTEADDENAGPVVEDPTFELRAEAVGPYRVGEAGRFRVRLTPRGTYHVNQQFPMTIDVSGPDGVQLPSRHLEAGGGRGLVDAEAFDEERAHFAVPVTPSSEGDHRVTARVNFAVCTPEACMPDERTLALVLPVSGVEETEEAVD